MLGMQGTPAAQSGLLQGACDSISRMRFVFNILLVLLMLVALPLRGYAAGSACAMHHGGAQAAVSAPAHDHASNDAAAASACSACAGCCVGPTQASSAQCSAPIDPLGVDRIPFFGKQLPVHVPDRLDRPPLAL